MTTHRIRVGIDVGGTFTDAVAVDATTLELLGQVKVPTSHHHEDGVAHGIVEALDRLLEQTGRAAEDVAFLAHGTTQATNALLEGDVATVGLIGIGTGPGAVLTHALASLGRLELAPGKRLPLAYAHVADPEDPDEVRTAVDTVTRDGAQVLVASEPFGVDRPEGEQAVLEAARPRGLPMTAAHEITSLYGLAKRTRTAVVNAAILPRMLATADLVDASITKAGVNAPLMVMRCDGGVMSLDEMRRLSAADRALRPRRRGRGRADAGTDQRGPVPGDRRHLHRHQRRAPGQGRRPARHHPRQGVLPLRARCTDRRRRRRVHGPDRRRQGRRRRAPQRAHRRTAVRLLRHPRRTARRADRHRPPDGRRPRRLRRDRRGRMGGTRSR